MKQNSLKNVNFMKGIYPMKMNLQASKLEIVQKLLNVQNSVLLEKIGKLLDKEMIVAYTTDGKPLTKEAYNKHLQEAEEQIRQGKVISHEELKKEIENW